MRNVRVLSQFRDKDNFSKIYEVGAVYSFEDSRADSIVKKGLGEYMKNAVEKVAANGNVTSNAPLEKKKIKKVADD